MFNIIILWISPLLLENVALRMSNLQVIKIRCCRVRTILGWVIGALIRIGMGNLLMFSIPCVLLFLRFSWLWILFEIFMRRCEEACVPRFYVIPLQSFELLRWLLLKNKLLFIHIWDDFCEMWHSVCDYSNFILENFTSGERGVTIGIRAGRSVRPSRWVVSCRVSVDIW